MLILIILINIVSFNISIKSVYAENKNFLSKKGFFYIQISGNGKTTKRKIQVTLNSTDRSNSQTVTFSDVSSGSDYANNHNFKILTTTSTTKKADKYYVILIFKFSYTKPAHYIASGGKIGNNENYRFNFNNYETGNSTVNSKGHSITNTTENIEMQINTCNCGFVPVEDGVTPSNATGCINLSKKYYSSLAIDPNGGNYEGKTTKYTYGVKVCDTKVTIGEPERKGYVFLGWTLTKGTNCSGATFNNDNGQFIYCGASTSSSSVSNDNTCTLKAQWLKNDSTLVLPEAGSRDLSILFIIIGCAVSVASIGFWLFRTLETVH